MMFLKFNFFKKKNQVSEITLNPSLSDIQSFFNTDIALTGSALTSATYYACMLIRCNAIAKLPLKLKQRKKTGTDDLTEHSVYKLLKYRPNHI